MSNRRALRYELVHCSTMVEAFKRWRENIYNTPTADQILKYKYYCGRLDELSYNLPHNVAERKAKEAERQREKRRRAVRRAVVEQAAWLVDGTTLEEISGLIKSQCPTFDLSQLLDVELSEMEPIEY